METELDRITRAAAQLVEDVKRLRDDATLDGRKVALAATNLETALLWLKNLHA
jgi:hypothetical protein